MPSSKPCHWPLCEIHNLPKEKGKFARAWSSVFSRKRPSNGTCAAKILELPVELIQLIADKLPHANAVAFAFTTKYIYDCIGKDFCRSLNDSRVSITNGISIMLETSPKNDFLALLQKDHPEYWHCTTCDMLHQKRISQSSSYGPADLKIDVGLTAPGLLMSIPLSDIREIQQYHSSYSKSGRCPDILSCHGTAHGRSGLSLSYTAFARIISCQLLWNGIFNIDWVGPSASPTSFSARTPFQICEHNRMIQDRLLTSSKSLNPPFISLTPQKSARRGLDGEPALVCMCCPSRLYGCGYCDTDFSISYTEDPPNQRQYRIEVWKNFGNMHSGAEAFPRKDMGWHHGSRSRRSPQMPLEEHCRGYPGKVKRLYEGRVFECMRRPLKPVSERLLSSRIVI